MRQNKWLLRSYAPQGSEITVGKRIRSRRLDVYVAEPRFMRPPARQRATWP